MFAINTANKGAGTATLDWFTPNTILHLTIKGAYTVENAEATNAALLKALGEAAAPLTLLIDCNDMARPMNFEVIRETQTFMEHEMLGHIYVASSNRLVRFAMMVIFNQSSAHLRVFESLSQAIMMIDTLKAANNNKR